MIRLKCGSDIRVRSVGVLLAGLAVFSSPARALPGDAFDFFVGESIYSDSNVFRDESNTQSDERALTSAGFRVDAPVGLQRVQAEISINDERYRRFDYLDFTGWNGRLAWLWQVGEKFSGQLGYTNTNTLASFSNIGGRRQDELTTARAFGNANWKITPSWELAAGLARQTQRNSDPLQRDNDIDLDNVDLGLNFISPATNRIGLSLRHENGDFRRLQPVGTQLIDNAYRQSRVGIVTDWTISAKSRLSARADLVDRNYDEVDQRDYDGHTFLATYDWQASEKLLLSAVAQRDISVGDDVQTRFVLVKGVALRSRLEMSEKTRLSASIDYSDRDYLGDAAVALGLAPERSDRLRIISLGVSHRPLASLTLGLSGVREHRSSNLNRAEYTANIFNIYGRFAF